ncbi:MAG TPA: TonB-dependent receptor, partial [Xanthomonadales bacterium]|nr:TonB-dependent receptor [Xanthomonadales bacterium]
PRSAAAAAVHVLSAEDLHRSGARSLPDALRTVPGVHVARIAANQWAVSVRGFGGPFSNKLLVLRDGRTLYTPLFAGVFWDVQDLLFEDVERVEVVRGPGGTLWGANAMNGVINVIMKSSADTQGTHVVAGAGDYEQGHATVIHGGRVGEATFRVFAKYAERDEYVLASGAGIDDGWSTLRTGFRVDGPLGDATRFMLGGHLYEQPKARASVRLPVPGRHQQFEQVAGNDDISGAHLIARAEHAHGDGSQTTVQAYLDGTHRMTARFGAERNTIDLDVRHRRDLGARHQLAFGLEYNHTEDDISNGPVLQFDPDERGWSTWNAYVQDTIALGDDASVAIGTKLTHHEFTGLSWQPGIRASWTGFDDHTFWGAVSRPVRVPSRLEEDGLLVFSYVDTGLASGRPASGVFVPLGLSGNDRLEVEELVAWELGHRTRIGERLQLDSTVFYNDYHRLIGVPPAIIGSFTDAGAGVTRGFDVSATFDATERWRLEGSFSRIDVEIDGPILPFEETGTPKRMAQLRSYFDVSDSLELTAAAYYVDEVPRIPVASYTRVDLGLMWRPRQGMELALFGQNLLEGSHAEASGAQVPRSWYAQMTLHFPD